MPFASLILIKKSPLNGENIATNEKKEKKKWVLLKAGIKAADFHKDKYYPKHFCRIFFASFNFLVSEGL